MLHRAIIVNDRCDFVADTVFNALKELRVPNKERRIWVDAIYINQGNLSEKGQQVALMGPIYQSARNVIVWLGKATASSKYAFNFAEQVAAVEPSMVNSLCPASPKWKQALKAMMLSRWWSRVWVVQEVVLAPSVLVTSGQNEIAWTTLVSCFQRLLRVPNHGLDIKVLVFVNKITELKRSDADPENGLLDLAIRFRDPVAGNPRDKLIGFRGLLRASALDIPADPYGKPAKEMFAHFAAHWIRRTGSLALIALAEDHASNTSTWVLDWRSMTSGAWRDHDPLQADDDAYQDKRDPGKTFGTAI